MKNFEERPWGSYTVLLDSNSCKVKKIVVNPSHRLSYQIHKKRSEYWVIVSGEGEVIIDDKSRQVTSGDFVKICRNEKHRIYNNSKTELVFIETQLGDYFGEDDIIRIEDDYNRI
tara:strand:- start:1933 stop:2277 length:345 start_codon:yes stop_codon:yes gene_type:complete